ncbi:type IV pilus modification PilV family protein [Gracilibacillus massiliensis]|uniref:type IV pilus modification PilV family protein n=1 Tax=Gracilibacillus massiliensis TaxID=1564956 RepID=UPI00071DE54B|nr:prepilin-type N-terminal cleavage/methylation domain-containing protein [Gracilibacillus massiliensis]
MIKKDHFTNNSGFTLIEILASVVILSLISFGFLALFTHASKSNILSENILDGNYIAQTEIEDIYQYSTETTITETISNMESNAYHLTNSGDDFYQLRQKNDDYSVDIHFLHNDQQPSLWRVTVTVTDERGSSSLLAKIESVYQWQ